MIWFLVRRRQWIALGVLTALIGVHAAMGAGLIPSLAMSMSQCLTTAIAL